jgi:hypothetical protein
VADVNLQQLIEANRRGRFNHQLAADCDYIPGEGQWARYSQGSIVAVPGVDSLHGIAKTLNVSVLEVYLAVGRTLGLVPPVDEEP